MFDGFSGLWSLTQVEIHICSLFSKFHRLAERYEVCVAKRGAKDRNQAIRAAIEHAERDFEQTFGFSRGGGEAWDIVISNPKETVCLQAVDYFLWAVQRFYEVRRHPVTGEEIRRGQVLEAALAANWRDSRPGFWAGVWDVLHSTTPAHAGRTLQRERASEKVVVSIGALKTLTARGRISLTTRTK